MSVCRVSWWTATAASALLAVSLFDLRQTVGVTFHQYLEKAQPGSLPEGQPKNSRAAEGVGRQHLKIELHLQIVCNESRQESQQEVDNYRGGLPPDAPVRSTVGFG